MQAIAQLERDYFLFRLGLGDFDACVSWAVERLVGDQDGDDLSIVLLAGATQQDEVAPLVAEIIARYSGADAVDDQFIAGKYVAGLRNSYLGGKEDIKSLDVKLSRLFQGLGYPDWLVMLTRNCEYATDIADFQAPFEQELSYIAGLWETVADRAEFEAKYSRAISDLHDLEGLKGC